MGNRGQAHQVAESRWLLRLTNLKLGKGPTGKPAPHKPIMLLCLLDLIDSGELTGPLVAFDVHLTQRFRDYWSLVAARQPSAPDMALPFHHLSSDGVWRTLTADGAPSAARATTRLCEVVPELWAELQDAGFRLAVRKALIMRYLEPLEQVALCARHGQGFSLASELDPQAGVFGTRRNNVMGGRTQPPSAYDKSGHCGQHCVAGRDRKMVGRTENANR